MAQADNPQPNEASGSGVLPRRHRLPRHLRHASRRSVIAINLAPMIDVTFLLLIFFLVTTTFEPAEGLLSSQMPQDQGAPSVALPLTPIVVRVAQVGPSIEDYAIRIDKLTVSTLRIEQLSGTLREIQQRPGFDEQTPVVIIGDNDVAWDHVVACWNAAVAAGCKRIAFGGS